jgi:hypothetical protein
MMKSGMKIKIVRGQRSMRDIEVVKNPAGLLVLSEPFYEEGKRTYLKAWTSMLRLTEM